MKRTSFALLSFLSFAAACAGSKDDGAAGGGPTAASTSPTRPPGGTADGAPASAPDASLDAAPAEPVASAGCGKTGGATGIESRKTTVAGVSRRYQLFVPAAYDASRPTRLVFVFHGLGGDGDQIRGYFGFEKEAAGEALFVYPDGVAQPEAGGETAWALGDVAFFDAMLSEISASHCVDTARVFAAGHSYGAYMSNLVGCERGNVVRAIAPVSGGIVAGTCKGPVAAWLAHGDSDLIVPQSEGIAARDHWTLANGCAKTSKPTSPSPCITYDGCTPGHPVTWCSFSGGHYPLPAYTQQAIWGFFKTF